MTMDWFPLLQGHVPRVVTLRHLQDLDAWSSEILPRFGIVRLLTDRKVQVLNTLSITVIWMRTGNVVFILLIILNTSCILVLRYGTHTRNITLLCHSGVEPFFKTT